MASKKEKGEAAEDKIPQGFTLYPQLINDFLVSTCCGKRSNIPTFKLAHIVLALGRHRV
jgi:hypothetical protein